MTTHHKASDVGGEIDVTSAIAPKSPLSAGSSDRGGLTQFLLVKRGLYWRPDGQGYTGLKEEAGRYTAKQVQEWSGHDRTETVAVPENEADDYAPNCCPHVRADHLQKKLAALLAQQSDEPQTSIALTSAERGGHIKFPSHATHTESATLHPKTVSAEPGEIGELVEQLKFEATHFKGFDGHSVKDALLIKAAQALHTLTEKNKELTAERDEAGKALVSLTPNGSEFYNRDGDKYKVDVKACLAYIRERRESQHNTICEAIKGRKTAEAQLSRVKEERDSFKAMASGSIPIANQHMAKWIKENQALEAELSTLKKQLEEAGDRLKLALHCLDWLSTWPGPDGEPQAKSMADYARKQRASLQPQPKGESK